MTSRVTHVRLASEDIAIIDEAVLSGRFLHRSDFLRSAVRLQIHYLARQWLRETRTRPTPLPKLLASLRASRRAVYLELFTPSTASSGAYRQTARR